MWNFVAVSVGLLLLGWTKPQKEPRNNEKDEYTGYLNIDYRWIEEILYNIQITL